MKQYLRNLGLWARGIRWLFTNGVTHLDDRIVARSKGRLIKYKPGWGPWRFLPIYLTTYLIGTLLGFGVVSISRAATDKPIGRLIDRAFALFGQENHCANAGPWLWGSRSAWE